MSNNDPRAAVIENALKDPAFKAELLKNPARAIEKETGVKVPAGTSINVHENTVSLVHLVLPLPAPTIKGELSDDLLSTVYGGAGANTSRMNCDSSNRPICVPF